MKSLTAATRDDQVGPQPSCLWISVPSVDRAQGTKVIPPDVLPDGIGTSSDSLADKSSRRDRVRKNSFWGCP